MMPENSLFVSAVSNVFFWIFFYLQFQLFIQIFKNVLFIALALSVYCICSVLNEYKPLHIIFDNSYLILCCYCFQVL